MNSTDGDNQAIKPHTRSKAQKLPQQPKNSTNFCKSNRRKKNLNDEAINYHQQIIPSTTTQPITIKQHQTKIYPTCNKHKYNLLVTKIACI